MNGRMRYAGMKSILEVPLLNEKYVSKVPTTPSDAVMLDLEDSAPPDQKSAMRERVLQVLANRDLFGSRHVIVRVNNLATDWGRDDLEALAGQRGEIVVCYPKVETEEELNAVIGLSRANDAGRGVYAMVETARAVIEMERIVRCDGLVGLHFGYVDFAADAGCQLFNAEGDDLHPAVGYARAKVAVAAAAYGLFSTGGSMVPDYKDLRKVETFVRSWADQGYTACIALSPSHLEIVNRVLQPSAAMIDRARLVCAAYEDATAKGGSNAILDGKVITTPDYRSASLLLARAGR